MSDDKHIDDDCELSRREMLRIGSVAAVGAVVGCSGGGGNGEVDGGVDAELWDAGDGDSLDASQVDVGPDVADSEPDGAVDAEVDEDAGPTLRGPFFALHVTDTHIGAQALSLPALAYAVNGLAEAIRPAVIVVTGDLVDQGYDAGMWASYAETTSVLASHDIIEVPGNHDAHDDPGLVGFLGSSMTGQSTATRYGHRIVEAAGRRVRFVATNTASAGDRVRNLTGYLESDQVDALLAAMESDTRPFDSTVVLGHHPLRGLNGLALHGTAGNMERLYRETAASAYLFGHVHSYAVNWIDGVLHVQGPTLGNPNFLTRTGFCLFGMDDEGPAVRQVRIEASQSGASSPWPRVLVTLPADSGLAGGNPNAAPLVAGSADNLVRAGVFGPSDPDEVSFRVNGGEWQPMARVGSWYEARFDAPPEAGPGSVEVSASAGGQTDSHSVGLEFA